MKLNELVCPSCGLKCLVDSAFTTCDGCSTCFTAAQSRSRDCPEPLGSIGGSSIQIGPIQPLVTPWIVTPNDPSVTGGTLTVSTGDPPDCWVVN